MHIVLVCREYIGSLRAGGIASYLEEISRAYINLGHKVTIVTASEDTRQDSIEEISSSFKIIRIKGGDFINPKIEHQNLVNRFRFLYRFRSYRKRLRNIITSIANVDIIEVPDYGAEGLYLQNIGIPVVLRLHTPLLLDIRTLRKYTPSFFNLSSYINAKAETLIFKNAKYISSCSSALLAWVRENLQVLPRLTSIVHNPINVNMDDLAVNTNKNNDLIVFYGGTICETKGVGDLIDACKIIRDQGIDIKLELAGKGGDFYSFIKRKAIKNNWTWISFLGKISRKEMFNRYVNATICCFPSWWDNMPMVCLESMAVGAIVIASSSGGAKEIITDSINGFIVERKNPILLAKCIQRVLSLDKKTLSNISINAKQRIQTNFNSQLIARQMIIFYQKVISDYKSNNSIND